LVKNGIEGDIFQGDIEAVQRAMESHNLESRHFLDKYETVIEDQRQTIQARRQEILESDGDELERLVRLTTIDDLWSDYLASVAEIRAGVHWFSYGGRQPLHEFLTRVDSTYREM